MGIFPLSLTIEPMFMITGTGVCTLNQDSRFFYLPFS